jgi:CBS-domain-containing membrane protein
LFFIQSDSLYTLHPPLTLTLSPLWVERVTAKKRLATIAGAKFRYEEEKQNAKVKDLVSREVHVLNEDSSIEEVMRLVFQTKVHTIPVTDSEGHLAGIIGRRDLVEACF